MSTKGQIHNPSKAEERPEVQALKQQSGFTPHPEAIIQLARQDPNSLTPQDWRLLQQTIGNRTIGHLSAETSQSQTIQPKKIDTSLPQHLKDNSHIPSGPTYRNRTQGAFPQKTNATDAAIQRMAYIISADQLTQPMQGRWKEASERFKAQIVDKSYLAEGTTNQVVLHGVSEKTHPGIKDNYASTTLYVGKNGYKGDEWWQFIEMWLMDFEKDDPPKDVSLRVVIDVNLSMNKSIQELYATLLHEWYAHAVKWEDTIKAVRQHGSFYLMVVKRKGHVLREDLQHIAYANLKDEEIEQMVAQLSLKEEEVSQKIAQKVKEDRNRYDKVTGKLR